MSDYVKCNHCGYYPSTNGYYCANCGNKVSNYMSGSPDSFGCFIAILALVALLFIGSFIFALVSLFQTIKKGNYKRALWVGIGGILWSVVVFIIFGYGNFLNDPDSKDFWIYAIWSNVFGLIVSLISTFLSISKLNSLNTKRDLKQINKKKNDEQLNLDAKTKSSKSKKILIVIISLLVICLVILYALFLSNNQIFTNSVVENNSSSNVANDIPLKYSKLSSATAKKEANETDVNIENDKNNKVNKLVPETIRRDPRTKDVANDVWDSKFTLFCKLTDEPIYPNSNNEYDIWYASQEEPYPHHKILTKQELPSLLFYKFKDYETCKKWCDAKRGN